MVFYKEIRKLLDSILESYERFRESGHNHSDIEKLCHPNNIEGNIKDQTEIEELKNVYKFIELVEELEKNEVEINSFLLFILISKTQWLGYKSSFELYNETGQIDEILKYIKFRFNPSKGW